MKILLVWAVVCVVAALVHSSSPDCFPENAHFAVDSCEIRALEDHAILRVQFRVGSDSAWKPHAIYRLIASFTEIHKNVEIGSHTTSFRQQDTGGNVLETVLGFILEKQVLVELLVEADCSLSSGAHVLAFWDGIVRVTTDVATLEGSGSNPPQEAQPQILAHSNSPRPLHGSPRFEAACSSVLDLIEETETSKTATSTEQILRASGEGYASTQRETLEKLLRHCCERDGVSEAGIGAALSDLAPRWNGGCEASVSGTGPWPLECSLQVVAGFPPLASFSSRPLVIVSQVPWFTIMGFDPVNVATCPVKCVMLAMPAGAFHPACIEQADVWLASNGNKAARWYSKPPWQWFMYWSTESSSMWSEMDDPAFMQSFELEVSYRQSSHIPLTIAPRDPEVVRTPVSVRKDGFVLYLQGNCVPWRDAIATEISRYLPVTAPGKCLNNAKRPKLGAVQMMARYHFVLAFENNNVTDWVTERVFNAWIAGAIPIYSGAPNMPSFAPHPRSFILLSDFSSARALAEYLAYLMRNHTARQSYLEFKNPQVPLSPGYLQACRRSYFLNPDNRSIFQPDEEDVSKRLHPDQRPISSFCLQYDFASANIVCMKCVSGEARELELTESDGSPEKGHVDGDGLSVRDPRSRCYEAFLNHTRHNTRGGLMDGCRICTEAHRAQQASREWCPAPNSDFTQASAVFVQPTTDAAIDATNLRLVVQVFNFTIPTDGIMVLEVSDVGAANALLRTAIDTATKLAGNSQQMAVKVEKVGTGRKVAKVVLVSHRRRRKAEASVFFTLT